MPAAEPASPVRVSVCLAAHDGAEYVGEQVRSILDQLGPTDELVVVDDASTDDTVSIVESFGDARVTVHRNDANVGSVRTFERALGLARGAYLLLADQDDVWVPGRLEAMVAALGSDGVVATSVAVLGDPPGPPRWTLRARDSHRYAANVAAVLVGVRWYFGCAMGLRRDLLPVVLPFPPWLTESHDLWIGLVGNVAREMRHLEDPSVERRLHGSNQTPLGWRSLPTILRARVMLARCLVEARRRSPPDRARPQLDWQSSGLAGGGRPVKSLDWQSSGPAGVPRPAEALTGSQARAIRPVAPEPSHPNRHAPDALGIDGSGGPQGQGQVSRA